MKEIKKMGKARKISLIAFLMCLALIMGCFLNGTFAKYTTKAEGSDTARVAKWGIQLNIDSDTFSSTYEADDKEYNVSTNSVESNNGEDVIAPGTSGSMSFSINGAPETALRLEASLGEFSMASASHQELIEVKAARSGYHAIEAFENFKGKFEVGDYYGIAKPPRPNENKVAWFGKGDVIKQETSEKSYYPVNWKLEKDKLPVAEGNLDKIEEYLTSISKDYAPNSDEFAKVCGDYTLSWNWAFESGSDELDTVLGNAASGIATEGYTCNLTEAFNFIISATQID